MTQPTFDPCKQWLGIDAVELGDPRRVLGLPPGRLDAQTIGRAATNRLALLQSVAPGAFAMAHAALVRRVTEARDTLLAESAALAAPGFSMPPPPDGVAPPMRAAPPVPLFPAAPSASPASGSEPVITLQARPVPRYRPQSSVGPVVMLVVAALGMVAGAMAYRTHQQSIARKEADKDSRRQVTLSDLDRWEDPPPPPVPAPSEEAPPPAEEEVVDEVSTSPPPMEQERRNEERRQRLKQQSKEPPPPPFIAPPQPPAKPEVASEPEAAAPPAETPAADVEGLLKEAFEAMQRQEFESAQTAIQAAREGTANRSLKERIASFKELAYYAEKFYEYREKALAALRAGIEYKIPTATGVREIAIVEITDKVVIYREAGRNSRWPRNKIPTAVLTHIVREWFDKRPENHLFLGAYFATKPEPDLANARSAWMTAKAGGADASSLLPLLDDPLLKVE